MQTNKLLICFCFYQHLHVTPQGGGGGYCQKNWVGGVQPASYNPYPIYDQNLRFYPPYLWLGQNIWCPICDYRGWHSCPKHNLWRPFVNCPINNGEKSSFLLKKHTQFNIRVQKPCPSSDQNGQNLYPIYDQNGRKTISFEATQRYIAHTREYPWIY